MPSQIWGTFAVNDHCRPNAFAREVLLFDRLVLPVPADARERERWRRPNRRASDETWDPDRLDRLLEVLGSQRSAGADGAQLAWVTPWDEYRWQFERNRLQVAEHVTADAFASTRMIVAMGEDLPGVIEAVAAFPSAGACRAELQPNTETEPPADLTATQALIALATPLLVPTGDEGKDFGPLRAAIELADDAQFRSERAAYYAWLRDFVQPLQADPAERLDDITLDAASVDLAEEQLRRLLEVERGLLGDTERRKRWTIVEYAMTVVGVSASVGLALLNPFAGLSTFAAVASFGGWVAGKQTAPPEARPLGGASMFLSAERNLGWGPER